MHAGQEKCLTNTLTFFSNIVPHFKCLTLTISSAVLHLLNNSNPFILHKLLKYNVSYFVLAPSHYGHLAFSLAKL